MSMRKLDEQEIRKITKTGNSFSVTIPIEIMRELGWRERQKIVVKRVHGGFNVRDWKNR